MSDDIVARLRDEYLAMTRNEAADAIEALKRENEALREALRFTLICAENGHDATDNARAALRALVGEK